MSIIITLLLVFHWYDFVLFTVFAMVFAVIVGQIAYYNDRKNEFKHSIRHYFLQEGDEEWKELWNEYKYVISKEKREQTTVLKYREGITKITFNFADCEYLEKLNLPESLETITDLVFEACTRLEEVFIPKNVKHLAVDAFYGCKSLSEFVVDKDNQKYESINGMIIDKKKKKLYMAPCGIGSFVSVDPEIPEGIASIGKDSFEKCSHIFSLKLPETLKYIEETAFFCCENLSEITIPKNVEYIGGFAFCACSRLRRVIIEGTPHISKAAFHKCSSIRVVRFMQRIELDSYKKAFSKEDFEFVHLEVPEADLSYYKKTSCFKNIVPF